MENELTEEMIANWISLVSSNDISNIALAKTLLTRGQKFERGIGVRIHAFCERLQRFQSSFAVVNGMRTYDFCLLGPVIDSCFKIAGRTKSEYIRAFCIGVKNQILRSLIELEPVLF